jgi:hypothetical protein
VLSIGAIMCRTGSQSEVARAAPVWATPALRTAVDRLDGRPVRDHYARSLALASSSRRQSDTRAAASVGAACSWLADVHWSPPASVQDRVDCHSVCHSGQGRLCVAARQPDVRGQGLVIVVGCDRLAHRIPVTAQ